MVYALATFKHVSSLDHSRSLDVRHLPRRQRCGALFVICTADLNGRGRSVPSHSFCIRMETEAGAVIISLDASEREKERETRFRETRLR